MSVETVVEVDTNISSTENIQNENNTFTIEANQENANIIDDVLEAANMVNSEVGKIKEDDVQENDESSKGEEELHPNNITYNEHNDIPTSKEIEVNMDTPTIIVTDYKGSIPVASDDNNSSIPVASDNNNDSIPVASDNNNGSIPVANDNNNGGILVASDNNNGSILIASDENASQPTNEDSSNYNNENNVSRSSTYERNTSVTSKEEWDYIDNMDNQRVVKKFIKSQENEIGFLRAEIHTKNELIDSLLKIIKVLMEEQKQPQENYELHHEPPNTQKQQQQQKQQQST